jgi:hypothetical protein
MQKNQNQQHRICERQKLENRIEYSKNTGRGVIERTRKTGRRISEPVHSTGFLICEDNKIKSKTIT